LPSSGWQTSSPAAPLRITPTSLNYGCGQIRKSRGRDLRYVPFNVTVRTRRVPTRPSRRTAPSTALRAGLGLGGCPNVSGDPMKRKSPFDALASLDCSGHALDCAEGSRSESSSAQCYDQKRVPHRRYAAVRNDISLEPVLARLKGVPLQIALRALKRRSSAWLPSSCRFAYEVSQKCFPPFEKREGWGILDRAGVGRAPWHG
jgi:hypothetical protein